MSFRKILFAVAVAEQKQRPTRQQLVADPVNGDTTFEYVLAERRALLAKVNELRADAGLQPVDDRTFVRRVENQSTGHFDYTSQLAHYASHLAHGTYPAM